MPTAKPLLNLFFPPQCLICDALVPENGTLCIACWQAVPFISKPMCACCGLPFEYAVDENTLCGECLQERPGYSRARSVFAYNDTSRSLILKLKFQDEMGFSAILSKWLAQTGQELIAASDLIVPVPLHYFRLVRRRYNQSSLLAAHLAKLSQLPMNQQALKRVKATTPQSGLSENQRKENVKRAFEVGNPDAVKNKSVLLIDDVMTTGSTIDACTKVLLETGASAVNVLTLARTI
jgi:ComF family protein